MCVCDSFLRVPFVSTTLDVTNLQFGNIPFRFYIKSVLKYRFPYKLP